MYGKERSVSDAGLPPHHPIQAPLHPATTAGEHSDNNSLRAVSSSFSANDSLNHAIQQNGGIGVKESPGVVTAVDSLEGEFAFVFAWGSHVLVQTDPVNIS
jgi:hypothetical protein